MNPCVNPDCRWEHEEGQHEPDQREYDRQMLFCHGHFCRMQHEDGFCDHDECNRRHGHSAEGQPRCEAVGSSFCEAFFSEEGCPFSHGLFLINREAALQLSQPMVSEAEEQLSQPTVDNIELPAPAAYDFDQDPEVGEWPNVKPCIHKNR